MSPATLIREKSRLPTTLRSAELSALPAQVRERHFFMAAVVEGEILQAFQDAAAEVAEGGLSRQEARRVLREKLTALGYEPEPGTAGTIKDLRSVARQNVVIDTNVAMVRGYAAHVRALKARAAFPAKQLVRLQERREKRPWKQLFAEAAAKVADKTGINIAAMAARVDHPVWAALSYFGQPYPPYHFNSGMGDKVLGLTEAGKLGIKPPPARPTSDLRPLPSDSPPSLNDGLEAEPRVTDPEIRQQMADDLRGLAEWQGEKLVHTDPNGTKVYPPDRLAEVIAAELPEDIPNLQAGALAEWAASGNLLQRGTDVAQDFVRFVQRTAPLESPVALTRAETFETAEAAAARVREVVREGGPFTAPLWALAFGQVGRRQLPVGSGAAVVRFIVESALGAKDITPSARRLKLPVQATGTHVYLEGQAFTVARVEQAGAETIVTLLEG